MSYQLVSAGGEHVSRQYNFFSPEEKAEIGKRTAEHGVTDTIRYWEGSFPGCLLKKAVYEHGRTSICKS